MTATHDTASLVHALYVMFNDRAFERARDIVAADHDWSVAATGMPLYDGDMSYVEVMKVWVAVFSDVRVEITNVVIAGTSAAVELVISGRHTGRLSTGAAMLEPTGRRLTLPATEIHEFADGCLRRTRTYYDGTTILAQLRATPATSIEEQNKAAMLRIYRIFNTGNVDDAAHVIATDMIDHGSFPGIPSGRGGFKLYVRMIRNAFPDLRMQVEQMIAEADTVVARVRVTGTHRAQFLDMPATGRRVDVVIVDIARFVDGIGVEHWSYADTLELARQLGGSEGARGDRGDTGSADVGDDEAAARKHPRA